MNRLSERTIAAVQIALGLAAAALAFAPLAAHTEEDGQRACMRDAFAYCSRFIPDHERVGTCLFANKNHISPACRELVKNFTPRSASAR